EESDRRARAGEKFVVRLKMPAETIVVDDLVRGRVEFPADALDDFILVRSDGHPLYHFTVCVDDADMRITHVLRGDDHLANTPKHVALFRALEAPVPAFAHLGMILGTDRKKLLWMNAQYMARLPAEELLERAKPHAPAGVPGKEAALAAIELHRTRARTAIEMGRALSTYAQDPQEYDPEGVKKNVRPETAL